MLPLINSDVLAVIKILLGSRSTLEDEIFLILDVERRSMEGFLSNALRSEKDMSIDFQKDKQGVFFNVNTKRETILDAALICQRCCI